MPSHHRRQAPLKTKLNDMIHHKPLVINQYLKIIMDLVSICFAANVLVGFIYLYGLGQNIGIPHMIFLLNLIYFGLLFLPGLLFL